MHSCTSKQLANVAAVTKPNFLTFNLHLTGHSSSKFHCAPYTYIAYIYTHTLIHIEIYIAYLSYDCTIYRRIAVSDSVSGDFFIKTEKLRVYCILKGD